MYKVTNPRGLCEFADTLKEEWEIYLEWGNAEEFLEMTREEIIEELKYLIGELEYETSQKHAYWIKQEGKTFKCSYCGNFLDMRGVNAGRGDANYCPNCGARMVNSRPK